MPRLLAAVEAAKGGDRGNAATGGRLPIASRKALAIGAGPSPAQAKTMLRIVNVPGPGAALAVWRVGAKAALGREIVQCFRQRAARRKGRTSN
jgi:hypothetical protein